MASGRASYAFDGTRVLVTGGSNGIGLGIARAFAAAGAGVTITGRRARAADYEHDLGGFEYRRAEMTEPDELDELAAGIDRLDVLVNNAGGNLLLEDEWRPEVFERSVQLGLFSAFRLAVRLKDRLARSRIEGGGSVLNMASMSAFRAVPIIPGYGSASDRCGR